MSNERKKEKSPSQAHQIKLGLKPETFTKFLLNAVQILIQTSNEGNSSPFEITTPPKILKFLRKKERKNEQPLNMSQKRTIFTRCNPLKAAIHSRFEEALVSSRNKRDF